MKVISGKIKDVEHLIETKMDQFKNMDLKELIPLIKKIAEGRIEMDKLKTSITNKPSPAQTPKYLDRHTKPFGFKPKISTNSEGKGVRIISIAPNSTKATY